MQFIGYAVGPFVAAMLLSSGGYDLVNFSAVLLFLGAALFLGPGVMAQRVGLRELQEWQKEDEERSQ